MKLSELKTGEKGVIVRVNGHGSFRKRLIEMGFIQGKVVRVILNAPLKDPIEYEIIGYKVSLRREEAEGIEVVGEDEAKEILHGSRADLSAIEADGSEDSVNIARLLSELAEERKHNIRVALVGNPNCGKTTLFNIASGSHEHVGNYSGVTVDAKEGKFRYKDYNITLVDLPGTYSLSAYSPEELYVRKNLIEALPDVVINVVDASNIERNLYLTTQLIDMDLRTVVALNMYDEMLHKGDKLDIRQLGHLLGVPICPTVSRDGTGIPELFDTVIKVYEHHDNKLARHIHINHGREMEESISLIQSMIKETPSIRSHYSTRYLAIKYLEYDRDIDRIVRKLPNSDDILDARERENRRITELLGTNTESAIVDAKYAFIQGALAETYHRYQETRPRRTITDRIDALVTNRLLAFPIFLIILYFVFWATFTIGQYPMDWIDYAVGLLGDAVGSLMKDGWVRDMVVDGAIAGCGSVLVFLPNIMILYFFISLMEDSGYMARAAFIVDKLMHKIGLHGKSFIPMVMGFGCNVPAIMATRSIENRKSRLITIIIIPFMSCAGRLPIFVLFVGAFFPASPATALMGIYLLGILLALLSATVLRKFIKDDDLPFVMELPPYRIPTGKSLWRHTWEKGKQYLQKMGTIILVFSVAIWFLGYFPHKDDTPGVQEHSALGYLGKAIEPAFRPLGFNWKMDVGLLAGVGAKELVVSTLGVMYSMDTEDLDGGSPENSTALQAALKSDISTAAALAFMIFVLLYFPCIATFVAVKSEMGGWKWAILVCAYTMLVAWIMAFIGYNLGLLLWP
ncbi:MAG: ferrous iron transport protein B [Bacteroidales bacterium]|nr:ferrous iron transport protein B [Bacteroidales bacterium]